MQQISNIHIWECVMLLDAICKPSSTLDRKSRSPLAAFGLKLNMQLRIPVPCFSTNRTAEGFGSPRHRPLSTESAENDDEGPQTDLNQSLAETCRYAIVAELSLYSKRVKRRAYVCAAHDVLMNLYVCRLSQASNMPELCLSISQPLAS